MINNKLKLSLISDIIFQVKQKKEVVDISLSETWQTETCLQKKEILDELIEKGILKDYKTDIIHQVINEKPVLDNIKYEQDPGFEYPRYLDEIEEWVTGERFDERYYCYAYIKKVDIDLKKIELLQFELTKNNKNVPERRKLILQILKFNSDKIPELIVKIGNYEIPFSKKPALVLRYLLLAKDLDERSIDYKNFNDYLKLHKLNKYLVNSNDFADIIEGMEARFFKQTNTLISNIIEKKPTLDKSGPNTYRLLG